MESSASSQAPSGSEPGGMRRALRYLSLRPYGDSLLTPAGAFWIFAVRIAILLMAAAEASAWSYAAFYLATGGMRWAAGIGAFLFTFATVCLIDASLMTLDRWARRYDHRVTGEPAPLWIERTRDAFSIGTRVVLVALSMYITAPFLAQLMFDDDIERALRDERVALRAKTRDSIIEPLRARAEALRRQLDERRAALDAEVAGAGASGRYGEGVAARQIRSSLEAVQTELAAVTAERERVATEFDSLSDAALAERYNLALPGDSFQERARVLAAIKNESYALTERAVQAFLAFLFVALVLLKLFEPRSIKVYFSERLQGLYRQYRGGLFDAHLDPAERSTGPAPMTSLRFEDWCLNTYASVRARDVATVRAGERTMFFGHSESELGGIMSTVAAEESQLMTQLTTVDARLQQAIADHGAARRALEAADMQVAELRAQKTTLEGGLKRPSAATTLSTIVGTLSELDAAAAAATEAKVAAQEKLDVLSPLLIDLEKRRADLGARLDILAQTRKQAETELAEVRLRHMAELRAALAKRWADAPAVGTDESAADAPKHVM